jgi:hypothetical protein
VGSYDSAKPTFGEETSYVLMGYRFGTGSNNGPYVQILDKDKGENEVRTSFENNPVVNSNFYTNNVMVNINNDTVTLTQYGKMLVWGRSERIKKPHVFILVSFEEGGYFNINLNPKTDGGSSGGVWLGIFVGILVGIIFALTMKMMLGRKSQGAQSCGSLW